MMKLVLIQENMLCMLLVMSSKAVNLEEPSVTLVPADVLATAISKTIAAGNDDYVR
jgi:hypothetical protein